MTGSRRAKKFMVRVVIVIIPGGAFVAAADYFFGWDLPEIILKQLGRAVAYGKALSPRRFSRRLLPAKVKGGI